MYPQNMSSVNQVAIPKRGYRWGYKFYLKVKNALFIWLFRLLSIDPSQRRALFFALLRLSKGYAALN